MNRTRIKLAVYADLDPVPGTFHSADSARNVVGNMLNQAIPHYNPMVSIESYDLDRNYHYDENLLIQARDLMGSYGDIGDDGIVNLIANAYEITHAAAREKIMKTSTADNPIDSKES